MTMKIRPAIDTLRALKDGVTIDRLAFEINSACNAVTQLGKPAEVTLKIRIRPYSGKGTKLKEPPILMDAEITTKLPKPDSEATIFFVDDDGNPVQTPPRKDPELDLHIAGTNGERSNG